MLHYIQVLYLFIISTDILLDVGPRQPQHLPSQPYVQRPQNAQPLNNHPHQQVQVPPVPPHQQQQQQQQQQYHQQQHQIQQHPPQAGIPSNNKTPQVCFNNNNENDN